MDITAARTFLAVADTGSFATAAKRLNITQSAVSVRIKKLEEMLGQPLFERGRFGAVATPAGRRFQASAAAIVRAWEVARATVGAAPHTQRRLILGAQYSIAELLVRRWLPQALSEFPELSFRIEAGGRRTLQRDLREGMLDMIVLFRAEPGAGVAVETIARARLLAVETPSRPGEGDIGVNWAVLEEHAEAPEPAEPPRVSFSLGSLARLHLLAAGGRARLPDFLIADDLAEGALAPTPGQPPIDNPVDVALRADFNLSARERLVASLARAFAPARP